MHYTCLYKVTFDLQSPWRIKPVSVQSHELSRQDLNFETKFPPALSLPMSQIDTSMVTTSTIGLVNYRMPKYFSRRDDT